MQTGFYLKMVTGFQSWNATFPLQSVRNGEGLQGIHGENVLVKHSHNMVKLVKHSRNVKNSSKD